MAFQTTIKKVYLVHLIHQRRNRRFRSEYVRDLFMKKNEIGGGKLVEDLKNDPLYHFKYFRMDKEHFENILEKIGPLIYHGSSHATPISPLVRLAVTLRYLASGNDQLSVAIDYRISPSSMCNIIREVMTAICETMEKEYLSPPETEQDWIKICSDFETKWSFPMCCGAFDGKHIKIRSPHHSGSTYFNYKGHYSVVLLASVDAHYTFSMVDIGACGSRSDGGILKRSAMGKKMDNGELNLPPPKQLSNGLSALPVFIGDDAFALQLNFMKPYPGKFLDLSSRVFNYRLSRARMVVENAFGILSARWRIFHSSIQGDLSLIKLIVKTCVILHNYLMRNGDTNGITADRFENENIIHGNWRETVQNGGDGMIPINRQGSNNAPFNAFTYRDLLKDYFMSVNGNLEWQETYVTRGFLF